MKIAVITPIVNGMYKDDTTMFCDGFEKLGHTVVRLHLIIKDGQVYGEEFNEEELKQCDVIWAPYEPLIPIAIAIRNEFKIPAVGHFEILPIDKFSLDIIDKHWVDNIAPIMDVHYNNYQHYCNAYMMCDAKTITCETHKRHLEKILGYVIPEDLTIKPYPIDKQMFDNYKDDTIEEKYQIVSSMRLVSSKKIAHVIKALSYFREKPPKYVVLGHGPEKQKLEKLAKELNVDVEFKGICSDSEKCRVIQESMFAVCLFAWLPMSEAAYYKKLSVSYDRRDTRERLGNLPVYTKENDIPLLATTLMSLCASKEIRKSLGHEAYKQLINGQTHTKMRDDACQIMVEIFEKVRK